MSLPAAATCQNHPGREAIGICIECRARICTECVTKVDGINFCVGCYAKLADRGARRRDGVASSSRRWPSYVSAFALVAFSTALYWVLFMAGLPGGG